MVAAKDGRAIPQGWALDAQGRPTTDPAAGLAGSMLPIGAVSSPKGEVLVADMLADSGALLPGARREALRIEAEAEGIEVAQALITAWQDA